MGDPLSLTAMNPTKLVLCTILLATAGVAAAQSSNRPNTLGGGGRYVFGQVNEFAADQYLLDTVTGRLWRLVDTADGGTSVLEAVPYLLPDGRTQALPPEPGLASEPPPARESVDPR